MWKDLLTATPWSSKSTEDQTTENGVTGETDSSRPPAGGTDDGSTAEQPSENASVDRPTVGARRQLVLTYGDEDTNATTVPTDMEDRKVPAKPSCLTRSSSGGHSPTENPDQTSSNRNDLL